MPFIDATPVLLDCFFLRRPPFSAAAAVFAFDIFAATPKPPFLSPDATPYAIAAFAAIAMLRFLLRFIDTLSPLTQPFMPSFIFHFDSEFHFLIALSGFFRFRLIRFLSAFFFISALRLC